MRIGIIGTENSHADHYVRHFNTESRFGRHRVTALAGGAGERNQALAETGRIDEIVDDPVDLIGRIDAAVICSRHGGNHPQEAVPLLRARIPVLVDKPLACDPAGAREILSAAHEAGVPVTSMSALRLAEQTRRIAATVRSGPAPAVVSVAGPADRSSEYGGLFFYGIHVVEAALALAPERPVEDLVVSDVDSAVVLTARAGPTHLLLEFDKPGSRAATSWRVRVAGGGAPAAAELHLGPDYILPIAEAFVAMLDSGQGPLPDGELLAPVEILSAANAATNLQSIA